jgi:hypothetical protein
MDGDWYDLDMPGRYWVFAYMEWEPQGGLGDLLGDFDTLEEVEKFVRTARFPVDEYTIEILDTEERSSLTWGGRTGAGYDYSR